MSEPFDVARASLVQLGSLHRSATLAAGGAADFGTAAWMKGCVQASWNAEVEERQPWRRPSVRRASRRC